MTGYMHRAYAESLAEFGSPWELPRCGGWTLKRPIPGFPYHDAMGCYPLFACNDWSQIGYDLEEMGRNLVSLALVTDPFGEYDESLLHRCFEDVVIPFKLHFVADLQRPLNEIVSTHHKYYARRALKKLCVEECHNPAQSLDEWVALYANLAKRHNLKGIKAFSKEAFAKQLSIPGISMIRAVYQNEVVGAQIWLLQGEVGYSHLTAVSEAGYELRVSYALYWRAIELLGCKVRWLDLGGGAGVGNGGTDGLSEFKKGWSSGERTAYFCGRIFNRDRYSEIENATSIVGNEYFPSYRKGEFG